NLTANGVTSISQFCDERKNPGKHVVGILNHPIEHSIPLRAPEPFKHPVGKPRVGPAVFFRTHYGSKSAPSDVKRAAFITEPRSSTSCAGCLAPGIASVGGRSRCNN